ncbi:MAG: hypothetical protein M1828_002985 [Chrysothrix sp. TS-e1954]|nr:MAG: hypothetical protein M1828_002985 [Chrysothrix sp. TS-e1954]
MTGSVIEYSSDGGRARNDTGPPRPPNQDEPSTLPRPIRASPASRRSVQNGGALSVGLSQKTPARSFSHKPPMGSTDPAEYSSLGVREQTAELASYALKETRSRTFSSSSSGSSAVRQDSLAQDRTESLFGFEGNRERRESADKSRPEVIEETSEPVSPNDDPSNRSSGPGDSALSSMFRHKPNDGVEIKGDSTRTILGKVRDQSSHPAQSEESSRTDESTPLLGQARVVPRVYDLKDDGAVTDVEGQASSRKTRNRLQQTVTDCRTWMTARKHTLSNPKGWRFRMVWQRTIKDPISLLPCVFLGLLLNVLDALSYGMILFPLGESIFEDTGPDGISMFYISCIVSQLVYSGGGSIFKGAVGSEMIEVVPFFHKIAYTILSKTGTERPDVVLATTITAYAMSSVLTGVVFFILGAFKLGSLVSFFPRHILIGCIGGVGAFLLLTGLEISARLDSNLNYDLETAQHLFRKDTILLWTIPFALSVLLLVIKRFSSSSYVVPAFFVSVATIFYILVTAVSSLNIPNLRQDGWVFSKVEAGIPFYHFYTYYNFAIVDWKALGSTVPAMFALTFFGVLHVPINIPALGVVAQEDDVDLNRELVAHGVSNAVSGFAGSIQNYLVYVNSEMFISNGGNNRLAGFMLAAATGAVLVAGPAMIGYVPVMVVGSLVFYLGIALLEEALYDTWGKMNKFEYLTVLAIVLIMGAYDFVAGIFAGIVLACLSFVVQTSRKSAIRATYSGEVVESTVRRHPIQRHFLHEVGHQIYVTKLAGYLFFGSIVEVEKQSRALIDEDLFDKQPIRYLIFDLAHVNGVDFSAAEAFGRIERILGRRNVKMLVSGIEKESEVGKSMRNAGLWSEGSTVELFEDLNTALEWCENELLKAFYSHQDAVTSSGGESHESREVPTSGARRAAPIMTLPPPSLSSPRQRYLHQAASQTLDTQTHAVPPTRWSTYKQPLPLLLQTFQDLTDKNEDFWFRAIPFFTRKEYPAGRVLFERGDQPKAFYLLQTGMLRATYELPVGMYHESIVAGTTCGELPFFSTTLRTATVVADRDCVAWELDADSWAKMQRDWDEGARELLTVALRLTKERVDAVTSYVLTAAG